jgi:hypothetical protein
MILASLVQAILVQFNDKEYNELAMVLIVDVVNPLRKHNKLIGGEHNIPAEGKFVILHFPEISPQGDKSGI